MKTKCIQKVSERERDVAEHQTQIDATEEREKRGETQREGQLKNTNIHSARILNKLISSVDFYSFFSTS